MIGYPIYWLELYVFHIGYGKTTFLAWIIVSIFALIIFFWNYSHITGSLRNFRLWFRQEPFLVKLLFVSMVLGIGVMLLSAFYAALLPPHLSQESDAINYHITLPRQHLLSGSFSYIPWTSADLFPLPIDFALAPFWLATSLPNKLPQFVFVIGLLGICARLAWRFSGGKSWSAVLVILAVLGSHNIGIQIGTAMLDIVICYLFLAAFDSFLHGAIWLGLVELSFYLWSKPLICVQFLGTLVIFVLVWLFLRFCGIRKNTWIIYGREIKEFAGRIRFMLMKGAGLFIIFTLVVAGPFIFKSLRYSGTPIFPLGAGTFKSLSISQGPQNDAELKLTASKLLGIRDWYGSGRSLLEFAKHFWLVAVPEKGVNNRYDYPLGLMYLLFFGPFLFLFISSLRKKVLPLISLWVIVSWLIWWFGSQQTRFLYVPLILMYLAVISGIRAPSRILLGTMLGAILLVSVSVYRANRDDFGKWGIEVLRPQDKELVRIGSDNHFLAGTVLPSHEFAYATFPVEAIEDNSIFISKER